MTDAELSRLLVLDTAPGPALAISAADANAIIDAALAGAGFGPGPGGNGAGGRGNGAPEVGGAKGSAGAKGAGAKSSAGASAAGTKIVIGAAIALVVIAVALILWRGRHGRAQLAIAPIDAAIVDAPSTGSGGAAPAAASAAAAPAAPVVATIPTDAAVTEDAPTIDMSGDESLDRPAEPSPKRTKPTRGDADTTDLLGEANAKRAAKQWRESDVLYAKVVKRAPNSLAAQTALIASASLHLEHLGDPKGAAQRFRRALAIAPAGALAEEARWGIAEAARAMKDQAAEAAALDAFLAHHGQSPLAERARTRRAQLP
jgi:hypothetical protein